MKTTSLRTSLALGMVLALGAGCGEDTGRARVRFAVTARGVDPSFVTSRGWSVAVTEARVVVGPLRWYEGAPVFALRWWERALGVSLAHAHPGHYAPGEALADLVPRRVVDLVGPPTTLGTADGITGAAQSAQLELRPPGPDLGPAAASLEGATLVLRGTATAGARTLRFRGRADVSLNLAGIAAPGAIDQAAWELQITLGSLLDRVDFEALRPATPDAEVDFGSDSQAANALYRAVTSVGSYRLVRLGSVRDAGR